MILPVVGLLLLLGLFWYWASTLIGDDDDNPSNITPTVAIVIDSTETPTATTTVAAGITATEGTGQTAGETPTAGSGEEETPTEEATESSDEPVSTVFAVDDIVVTNDAANLRTEPSADSDAITTLDTDTELIIIGGPEADADVEGRIWWEVRNEETEDEGWVVEEAIDAAS